MGSNARKFENHCAKPWLIFLTMVPELSRFPRMLPMHLFLRVQLYIILKVAASILERGLCLLESSSYAEP